MPNEVYDESQCSEYNFGDAAAPEGFDPNATGWQDPPPGDHIFQVDTFVIEPEHEFKWTDQTTKQRDTYLLNQLRPTLVVAEGPSRGARIMDFLPMPTPGRPMATGLANKWANFLKALGFDLPANKMVPDGFKLPMIKGPKFRARIVCKTEQDGKTLKIGKKGLPMVEVDFFGYSRLDASTPSTPTPSSNGRAKPATAKASAPAAAAAEASAKPFDPYSDL